jgi:hypothetical protein
MAEPEVWLRGPIAGLSPYLQPVAHSLLQSREEVTRILPALSRAEIWSRPGDAASVGFHARHAAGSLDRLTTYARGEQLTRAQLAALGAESELDPRDDVGGRLLASFAEAVDRALAQLRQTADATLLEPRQVGRARLPSTVIGLLFHAAEHTQRHVGQLVSTAKIVRGAADNVSGRVLG